MRIHNFFINFNILTSGRFLWKMGHGWKIFNDINHVYYSPAAIVRNVKIWNIILLLAFFQMLSSNLDLEYPAVSEENCLKNLLSLPWPLISWEFRHF